MRIPSQALPRLHRQPRQVLHLSDSINIRSRSNLTSYRTLSSRLKSRVDQKALLSTSTSPPVAEDIALTPNLSPSHPTWSSIPPGRSLGDDVCDEPAYYFRDPHSATLSAMAQSTTHDNDDTSPPTSLLEVDDVSTANFKGRDLLLTKV